MLSTPAVAQRYRGRRSSLVAGARSVLGDRLRSCEHLVCTPRISSHPAIVGFAKRTASCVALPARIARVDVFSSKRSSSISSIRRRRPSATASRCSCASLCGTAVIAVPADHDVEAVLPGEPSTHRRYASVEMLGARPSGAASPRAASRGRALFYQRIASRESRPRLRMSTSPFRVRGVSNVRRRADAEADRRGGLPHLSVHGHSV